jgi:two-component system alkaline phosphatase synthesis response regulator PhoP
LPKILVIEDEASIQKLTRANLAASGYQVLTVADGDEGLRKAKTERPDLVLLDLMLPGMSGWDVLTAIRTSCKLRKTPVVIMTAAVLEGDEYQTRGVRTNDYLIKPFAVEDLLQKVKRILGG